MKRLILAGLFSLSFGFSPSPAPAQTMTGAGFTGAGSTLAQPILARWGQIFTNLAGEGGDAVAVGASFDYEPVGSLGGIVRAIQRSVDFGATDSPLTPAELDQHGLVQFPFVTGGIAVVVNLRGVAQGGLRLSGPVLARIYLGEITRWSDPAIRALNPGVMVPDAPIAVVRRSDGSGTTFHFARFLAAHSDTWRDRVGVNTLLTWPVGTGAEGNRRLAERVQATENAIGYVEASQAARLGLNVALIENRAGRFVPPQLANLQAAAGGTWDPAQHFYALPVPSDAAEAYPIVATVFALMPRQPRSVRGARLTLAFFRMALTERAEDAAALGFVALPPSVVQQVLGYWTASFRAGR